MLADPDKLLKDEQFAGSGGTTFPLPIGFVAPLLVSIEYKFPFTASIA
jgi:hypothetical protein